jgi:hypothetical protein
MQNRGLRLKKFVWPSWLNWFSFSKIEEKAQKQKLKKQIDLN